MILTSPSTRHHRNQLTWTSGQHKNQPNHHHSDHSHSHNHNHIQNQNKEQSSLRQYGSLKRAPPAQQPPKPPSASVSNDNHPAAPFRSHTLNRFDLQQRRNQANNKLTQTRTVRSPLPLINREHLLANGYQARQQQQQQHHQDIYAPASIASPAELAHYKRPANGALQRHAQQSRLAAGASSNGLEASRHYAATSYREPPPHSTFSEPGRCESALGNLLERFGSLRRRATWSKLTSSKRSSSTVPNQTSHYYNQRAGGSPSASLSVAQTDLDEIYARTSGSARSSMRSFKMKKPVEAEEIYAEGLRAIDGNGQKRLIEHQLNESIMIEGETRHLIVEESQQQPEYQLLINQLSNWINDELAQQRIVVRDLQEDLYDGQILGKLIEKLHLLKLDLVEVTQNELTQKYKLKMVLDTINRILSIQARWARIRWTVEGIHSKNMVQIVQLLVTLSLHYRAPIQLPADVRVQVLVVQKNQGLLVRHIEQAQLTCKHEAELSASVSRGYHHQFKSSHLQSNEASLKNGFSFMNQQQQPQQDAFDTLCEFNPEKLTIVKQSLVNFVNRHLNKINMSCLANRVQDVLDPEQFSDGLLLVFLMASLEDYFVPLGNLFTCAPSSAAPQTQNNSLPNLTSNSSLSNIIGLKTALEPTSYTNTQPIHKLHNVNVAIQLMDEAGIDIKLLRVRAEDIVNGDLKSILRVLYALFSRYKHL